MRIGAFAGVASLLRGAVSLLFLVPMAAMCQLNVVTYHYDNFRTGQNLREGTLTPGKVNQNTFGKLFSQPVDGQIYAQPLELRNVQVPGKGQHNVVYVVTEHDSAYAFDADSNTGSNASPLWQDSFIDPANGITPIPTVDTDTQAIYPEIGITSTPVIDPGSGTLYVVAATKESGTYVHRLHALDVASGTEKFGGPVVIQATVSGNGWGSVDGKISFDPLREHQRAALLLSRGVVYIAWASHGKEKSYPYHGWVMGYDAGTLAQVAVFNSTPNGKQGGIWLSGGGLAEGPRGDLFTLTGNGTFDADDGGVDYGDSFLKLTPSKGLTVTDYFTPFNQEDLSNQDQDLGSGEPMVLPGPSAAAPPHLAVGAGKEGTIYLIDLSHMGGFNDTQNLNLQTIEDALGGRGMHNSPAFWQQKLYFCASADVLRIFQMSGGLISPTPIATSVHVFQTPGATPVISARGASRGIVWLLEYTSGTQQGVGGPGVLYALDPTTAAELYNSNQAGSRDVPGLSLHFNTPMVANGKVYVGTANELDVFGLLSQPHTQAFPPHPNGLASKSVAPSLGGKN
ncbi:MAG: pyrrolo-quinoline quinone [Acidobacteriia bacterium]|nr:pyrrolo-quinoline quinone [Terriglobia bacterium]